MWADAYLENQMKKAIKIIMNDIGRHWVWLILIIIVWVIGNILVKYYPTIFNYVMYSVIALLILTGVYSYVKSVMGRMRINQNG